SRALSLLGGWLRERRRGRGRRIDRRRSRRAVGGAADDRELEELGDVERLHALVFVGLHGGDTVLEHLDAERAGGGDDLRAGAIGLLRSGDVDALALRLFDPHVRAAGAAAEA